jgi:hypothetical protein
VFYAEPLLWRAITVHPLAEGPYCEPRIGDPDYRNVYLHDYVTGHDAVLMRVAPFVEKATFRSAWDIVPHDGSTRWLAMLRPGSLRKLGMSRDIGTQAMTATLRGCSQLTSLELDFDPELGSLPGRLSAAICSCTMLQVLKVAGNMLVSSGLHSGCTALTRLEDLHLDTRVGEGLPAAPETANLTRLPSLTHLVLEGGQYLANHPGKALAWCSMDAFPRLERYHIADHGNVQVSDSPLFFAHLNGPR